MKQLLLNGLLIRKPHLNISNAEASVSSGEKKARFNSLTFEKHLGIVSVQKLNYAWIMALI